MTHWPNVTDGIVHNGFHFSLQNSDALWINARLFCLAATQHIWDLFTRSQNIDKPDTE